MELRDLRTLNAVIEAGGMTRAAVGLHVVQSAVSQAIKRLEAQVGQPLLERRPGGVVPTAAGVALHDHAELILNYVERAEADMRAFRGLSKGSVRLGMLSTSTPFALGPLLRTLRQHHPGLLLHVEEDLAAVLVDRVRSGHLDMTMAYIPADTKGLIAEPIVNIRLAVVVGREHRLSARRKVRLTELTDEPWITFPDGNPARRWLEDSCFASGFHPQIAVEIQSLNQLVTYVSAGVGIGMIPSQAALVERHEGPLRVLDVSDPLPSVVLGVVHEARRLSPAARAVLRSLIEVLQAPN